MMFTCRRHSLLASWYILAFSGIAASQSICTENVTISTAIEAQSLRERCTVLNGGITFPGNLSESINLDGIEVITGDLFMQVYGYPLYYRSPYEISSSTLKTVGGEICFGSLAYSLAEPEYYQARGLEKVSFPRVMNISGGVQISAPNLTHLDLTGLQYFSFFALETPRLKQLKLHRILGFNDNIHFVHVVKLSSIGNVESIDEMFSEPVNQKSPNPLSKGIIVPEISFGNKSDSYYDEYKDFPDSAYANGTAPNLRNLTLGWEIISRASFVNMNVSLVLGGTRTESISFDGMLLERGIYNLQRGPSIQNLTSRSFEARNDFNNTELTIPFDNVKEVIIDGTQLRSITLPQRAENWTYLNFELRAPSLRLDNLTAWHWPRKFENLKIEAGAITDEFFEPVIKNKTKVVERFHIVDRSKTLDCVKLYKKGRDTLGNAFYGFYCEGKNVARNGALSIKTSRSVYLWAYTLAVFVLLL